ncbi:MAG TPA: PDDEXK nuclease domain-containing protein [bacterium]|nr:PDDEXK nuclease domain-containing protein [bacterium]
MKKVSNLKNDIFDRVVSILEEARNNVVRAVNSNMVTAYWLIGREIVEEIQGGEERAEYGKKVVFELSENLTKRHGEGFSLANIKNFRQFYISFADRLLEKSYLPGSQSSLEHLKSYPSGGEFDRLLFSSKLSWSHYRALMRVANKEARDFYEQEAIECGWSKAQLERQIHSAYYERIIKNKGKEGLLPSKRDRLAGEVVAPEMTLKSPVMLEFLGLSDKPELHESSLEQAIINNLQLFLLELGKGFSFVARQKHIRFDDDDFYIDLVFYNYILKCFVLVDLKIGKLTHRDVGQMDGYVRMFESVYKTESDNPTIGLILCTEKKETVAKYSVLNDRKQIFASKYILYLPTESELKKIIQQEQDKISNPEK